MKPSARRFVCEKIVKSGIQCKLCGENIESTYLSAKKVGKEKEIPEESVNAKPTTQKTVINNNHPMDIVDSGECFVTIADERRSRSERTWRGNFGTFPVHSPPIKPQRVSATIRTRSSHMFGKSASLLCGSSEAYRA